MKFNALIKLILCSVALACALPVQAANTKGTRDLVVEDSVNDYSQKAVFIDVDHQDHVYEENDLLVATVMSDSDGYLYLLHIGSTGEKTVLFPNELFNDNRIKANQTIQYPTKGSSYRFRVSGPNFGRERIVAYVTSHELKSINPEDFNDAALKALDRRTESALTKELENMKKDVRAERNSDVSSDDATSDEASSNDYAMSYVDIETTGKSSRPSSTGKTFAVCVGIGAYRSSKIARLKTCVPDAEAMADIFVNECGVAEKDCVVLCDEDATLETIREVFVEILPEATKPGDVVYLYWSGHGQTLKGVGSENNADRSEYLVPYDADVSSINSQRETLLHEDTFGTWVRNLGGRKILLFLDACYSGGMLNDAKSAKAVASNDSSEGGLAGLVGKARKSSSKRSSYVDWEPFQFGMNAFSRSKALGQTDLYVLASSATDQPSWVRAEQDLSVMTHVLAETIETGSSSMTHKDLYDDVKKGVDDYMESNYPNARQSVVFKDDLNPGLKLKK